jgi:predicted RNA-binding Zn ribbon-like protein
VVSTPSTKRIPHSLDLLIDFVNTLDIDEQTDALASVEGLRGWFADRGLLKPRDLPLGEHEREAAVRLREALRALLLEHNGGEPERAAARALQRVAREGELGVHFAAGGQARLEPCAGGFPGALAALLVPVAEGSVDGSWARVKACRADDCVWAFYDSSRNRSGVWCNMAVCGNRAKVRAYRSRHVASGS